MSLLCSNCRETYCRGDSTVAFESDGRDSKSEERKLQLMKKRRSTVVLG